MGRCISNYNSPSLSENLSYFCYGQNSTASFCFLRKLSYSVELIFLNPHVHHSDNLLYLVAHFSKRDTPKRTNNGHLRYIQINLPKSMDDIYPRTYTKTNKFELGETIEAWLFDWAEVTLYMNMALAGQTYGKKLSFHSCLFFVRFGGLWRIRLFFLFYEFIMKCMNP